MDNVTAQNQHEYDSCAEGWRDAMSTNMGHLYLEKPAMERELPGDLTGKTVLCIGVGSGEELGMILTRNPGKVVATDISAKLLAMAQKRYPEVECKVLDMMVLDFLPATFDVIYSSLAFHYANDWDHLLRGIWYILKPGGVLIFSTHHPHYWAKHPTGNVFTNARGVKLSEHTATLPGGVGVIYYNHPGIDSIRDALVHVGFRVMHTYAPRVVSVPLETFTPLDRKKYKNLVKTNAETPLFLVVRAQRQ